MDENTFVGDFDTLRNFVNNHIDDNVATLRLAFAGKEPKWCEISAIDQIECRQRTASKLASFNAFPDFIYPSVLSSEQCTAEAVARYHASLVNAEDVTADMTAGLGIDALTIAAKAAHTVAIERFPAYCHALSNNAKALGRENFEVVCADSMNWLRDIDTRFDVIFIDPARRAQGGGRVYAFNDCEPDVAANYEILKAHAQKLMIKASPMLDINSVAAELPDLTSIHIVSLRGECKEILAECVTESNHSNLDPEIIAIDIAASGALSIFRTKLSACGESPDDYLTLDSSKLPLYLYEPNASVMKTGAWKALTTQFPLLMTIAPNTHLFAADTLYENFPGRIVGIESEPDKKALKQLKGASLNVVARNYPQKASEIASQLHLAGSPDKFLYCFRDSRNKPRRILAKRILSETLPHTDKA